MLEVRPPHQSRLYVGNSIRETISMNSAFLPLQVLVCVYPIHFKFSHCLYYKNKPGISIAILHLQANHFCF